MLTDGFFALQTPGDLLKKLRHDLERCRANPLDTYAAFDFVVTGTQMHEWAHKHGITERPTDALHQLVFALCGALGNGAKHFAMRDRRPSGHAIREGGFAAHAFAAHAFDVGDLVVYLDARETEINGAPSITVLELAAMVVQYWTELLPE